MFLGCFQQKKKISTAATGPLASKHHWHSKHPLPPSASGPESTHFRKAHDVALADCHLRAWGFPGAPYCEGGSQFAESFSSAGDSIFGEDCRKLQTADCWALNAFDYIIRPYGQCV